MKGSGSTLFRAVLFLAAFGATPAPAQVAPPKFNPKAPENGQVLAAFSYVTVEPVLTQIGATFRRGGSSADKPMLFVTFPNDRKATLAMSACNSTGSACKAMSVQSYWTKIANATPEQAAEAIAGFDQRFAFAKAFVAEDGRPALQRYLTADYGYVRGNLAVNLLVFANQADRFATDVLGPLEAKKP